MDAGVGLSAKYKHIERRPSLQHAKASFGTCIHDALEMYNNGVDIELCVERFKHTWDNPEVLDVVPDIWPERGAGFGALRKKGIEMLRTYHKINRYEEREIIGTEIEFLVPFGDHELKGYVDLLEIKKSNKGVPVLRVVDYKTNARQPTKLELAFDVQFTAYVYASYQPEFWAFNPKLYNTLIDYPRRAIWYHMEKVKEIDAGSRDEADFNRMYRVAETAARAIEADIFMPDISGETCKFCSFKEECTYVNIVSHKIADNYNIEEDEESF